VGRVGLWGEHPICTRSKWIGNHSIVIREDRYSSLGVAPPKFKSRKFLKLVLNSNKFLNFVSKCLFVSLSQQRKYSGLFSLQNSPQNILQIFLQISPSIFFLEILSKYYTDISPNMFLLRNTLRIIFKIPTNIF
jgi:hypothetical protein